MEPQLVIPVGKLYVPARVIKVDKSLSSSAWFAQIENSSPLELVVGEKKTIFRSTVYEKPVIAYGRIWGNLEYTYDAMHSEIQKIVANAQKINSTEWFTLDIKLPITIWYSPDILENAYDNPYLTQQINILSRVTSLTKK